MRPSSRVYVLLCRDGHAAAAADQRGDAATCATCGAPARKIAATALSDFALELPAEVYLAVAEEVLHLAEVDRALATTAPCAPPLRRASMEIWGQIAGALVGTPCTRAAARGVMRWALELADRSVPARRLVAVRPAPHLPEAGCGWCACGAPASVGTSWALVDGAEGVAHCPTCFAVQVGPAMDRLAFADLGELLGRGRVQIRGVCHEPGGGVPIDMRGRVQVRAPSRLWARSGDRWLPSDGVESFVGSGWGARPGQSLALAVADAASRACLVSLFRDADDGGDAASSGRLRVAHRRGAPLRLLQVRRVRRNLRDDELQPVLVVEDADGGSREVYAPDYAVVGGW